MAISESNIHVGWIDKSKGYVKHKSVAQANEHEKSYPGTEFIFLNGDRKVQYMTIDEVNSLTVNDLLRKDPCDTTQKPCGCPGLRFFGGRGIGASAHAVVDINGKIIAADIIDGGRGYKTPPQVSVIDPCKSGSGAVLQTEIKDGVVVRIILKDVGSGYIGCQPATPQYPALVKLAEVRVANPGINYECGKDKLTVTPNNGTVLSYTCGPFGKIKAVKVEKGGNFTEVPRITMPSDTGLNAAFTPVFDIIRDPLTPEVALPNEVVQVYDLVGLNNNGYVDGKPYYGNVYFSEGVKYAGTQQTGGTVVRVFDTIQESVAGSSN